MSAGSDAYRSLEPGDEPGVTIAQIVLAGVVRAVGEPEADRGRADLARDLDALAAVLERPGVARRRRDGRGCRGGTRRLRTGSG